MSSSTQKRKIDVMFKKYLCITWYMVVKNETVVKMRRIEKD